MIERKILKNISNFFSLNVNKLSLIEDTRKGNHSKYQIGIKLNSKEEYNKILNKLSFLLNKTNNSCKKTKKKNVMVCSSVNNKWEKFGQKPGTYGILYPESYSVNEKVYKLNHGIQERLLLEPSIFTKDIQIEFINNLKSQKGGKLYLSDFLKSANERKKKEKNKEKKIEKLCKKKACGMKTDLNKITKKKCKVYCNTKDSICNKYKDQSIRGTPKNWAYNKCMKQPKSRVNNCKRLPPKGWNMYRYFCE